MIAQVELPNGRNVPGGLAAMRAVAVRAGPCGDGEIVRPTGDAILRSVVARFRTATRPAHNRALEGRGALAIRFGPATTWQAVPAGMRGRQAVHGQGAILTCLTIRMPVGMALTHLGESLPR